MEENKSLYCRFCVEPKSSAKILHLETNKTKFEDVVEKLEKLCCPVDFASTLPKTVCSTCYNLLNKTCTFIEKINESQKKLNDIFVATELKKDIKLEPKYECDEVDVTIDKIYDSADIKSPKHEIKDDTDNKDQYDIRYNDPISNISEKSWKSYEWSCKYCVHKCNNVSDLRIHCKNAHKSCNGLKCADCEEEFLNFSQFVDHVVGHRLYLERWCLYCDEEISTSREQHMSTHLTSANRICHSCGEIHSNTETLALHQQLYNVPTKQIIVKAVLSCHICLKEFKTRAGFVYHIKSHDPNRKREFSCEECGKMFYSNKNLLIHMLTHTQKPHVCKICCNCFVSAAKLRSHVNIHTGTKPFTCDQCGRSFRLKAQLKSHKIMHTDEKPFKCSECDKSFRYKANLNIHLRQHTGVKPYSCDDCERMFTDWTNFNKHMVRKHKIDMAKRKIISGNAFSEK